VLLSVGGIVGVSFFFLVHLTPMNANKLGFLMVGMAKGYMRKDAPMVKAAGYPFLVHDALEIARAECQFVVSRIEGLWLGMKLCTDWSLQA
jgi:hypothetical protein